MTTVTSAAVSSTTAIPVPPKSDSQAPQLTTSLGNLTGASVSQLQPLNGVNQLLPSSIVQLNPGGPPILMTNDPPPATMSTMLIPQSSLIIPQTLNGAPTQQLILNGPGMTASYPIAFAASFSFQVKSSLCNYYSPTLFSTA